MATLSADDENPSEDLVALTNLSKYPALLRYLHVDVPAVGLADKVKASNDAVESYPFLILDGSSGVGKTQTFFSLLKDKNVKSAVYLLMIRTVEKSQLIYKQMAEILGLSRMLDAVDEYVNNVTKGDDEDLFSVTKLRDDLSTCKKLQSIRKKIAERQLKATKKGDVLGLERVDSKNLDGEENLDGKVLFIDEVLPSPSGATHEEIIRAQDRLRFLRNFGRALNMRVILAGTATTAVNMTSAYGSTKDPASRSAECSDIGWAQVQLVSNYTKPFPTAKHTERPLIRVMWHGISGSEQEDPSRDESVDEICIIKIGEKLRTSKNFTKEGMLTWLSGAWLDSSHLQPSPFLLEPATLVRSHMFDPAISVQKNTEHRPIYMGVGNEEVLRFRGPLRVHVHRYDKWWSLMYPSKQAADKYTAFCSVQGADKKIKTSERPPDDEQVKSSKVQEAGKKINASKQPATTSSNKRKAKASPTKTENNSNKRARAKTTETFVPSYTKDFRAIYGAFSHCVQACLAIEPVMATALSSRHSLKPGEFREAIKDAWKETVFQRTNGAIDGEMNEHAMFAALQLASHKEFPKTQTVEKMLSKLISYLESRAEEPEEVTKVIIHGDNEIVRAEESSETKEEDFFISYPEKTDESQLAKKILQEKMPWLVPAYSAGALQSKIDEAGEKLFGDINLCGLVPGATNSFLDASAYGWEKDLTQSLKWRFEFRARSSNYSTEQAFKDLDAKCEKLNGSEFHAMLIAVTGGKKNSVATRIKGNKIRLVLVVGNGNS